MCIPVYVPRCKRKTIWRFACRSEPVFSASPFHSTAGTRIILLAYGAFRWKCASAYPGPRNCLVRRTPAKGCGLWRRPHVEELVRLTGVANLINSYHHHGPGHHLSTAILRGFHCNNHLASTTSLPTPAQSFQPQNSCLALPSPLLTPDLARSERPPGGPTSVLVNNEAPVCAGNTGRPVLVFWNRQSIPDPSSSPSLFHFISTPPAALSHTQYPPNLRRRCFSVSPLPLLPRRLIRVPLDALPI